MRERLEAVQRVISGLQYNHTGAYYFNVSKQRPYARIMDTAREILRDGLPIKCIEAVFLGMYLTCGWEELERIPVGFKSRAGGQVYRCAAPTSAAAAATCHPHLAAAAPPPPRLAAS